MDFDLRLSEWRESLDGEWVATVEAVKFVEMMQRDHPAEFREWMSTHAVQFVTDALTRQANLERQRALRSARARGLDGDAIRLFKVTFVVNGDNVRKPLAKMTREECFFAADVYESGVDVRLALAAFLRAVGQRIEDGVPEDVMAEDEAENLLREFVPDAVIPAAI